MTTHCSKLATSVLLAFIVILSGCASAGNSNPSGSNDPILHILIPDLTPTVGMTEQVTVTATDTHGNPVTIPAHTLSYSTSNKKIVTISSSGLVDAVAVGTATITVSGGKGYTPASAAITVSHQSPSHLLTIVLAASKTSLTVGGTAALTATGTDQYGAPFSFTPTFDVIGTAVTVSGTTATAVAQGSASITATASGVVSNAVAFTVSPLSQSITFNGVNSSQYVGNTYSVSATASSGLPVTITPLNPTICNLTTAIAPGTCTLQATQLGNAQYAPATPVNFIITVSAVPAHLASITLSIAPTSIAIGGTATLTASGVDQYNNPFSITPAFSIVSGSAVTISGVKVTGTAQGSSLISASASGITSNQVSIVVALDAQTISVSGNTAGIQIGSAIALTATSTSNLPVTLTSLTPTICSATQAFAVGACSIQATQLGNSQYGVASPVTVTFSVAIDPQTITFPALPSVAALSSITPAATASSNLPVTFTSLTPSVCSVTQALTSGTCTIQANQAGNAQYSAAAPVQQSFTVTLASQTITFPALTVTGTTFSVVATSTSGLPVTFQSDTQTICSITAGTGIELLSGTCTIEADQAGNNVYAAATPVTQSITIGQSLTAISVSPANASAFPGFSVPFTASAYDQFNQLVVPQPVFTWASSNPAVTVDGGGNAIGAAVATPTTANITASAGGVTSGNAVFTLNPAILTSVILSPSSATISAPSGSTVFSVVEQDQFGRPMAPYAACTYSSDNTAAATIDPASGIVTSQNATPNTLTANISAVCGGLTTNTAVLTVNPQVRFAKTLVATPNPAAVMQTITPTLPQSVAVNVVAYDEFGAVFATPMIDVNAGYDTTIVSATALNSGEGNQIIVQGVGIGSTTVTVHIDTDDSVSTSFVVNVTACTEPNICYVPVLTTINITGGTQSMEYQGTTTFLAQAFDQKGGGFAATFTWASTDTSVLTVDASGNVMAVGVGTASITAASGGETGTSQPIIVSPIAPSPISITSLSPALGAARITTAPQGMRTEPIAITGTGFASGATVTFGSTILPATFVSSTQLTVSVPAMNLAVTSDTNVPVFVTNPANPDFTGPAISNSANFLIFTEGMVSITFDDAYTSAYQYGIPIFNNAGLPITAMIITGNTCVSLGTCAGANSVRADGYPWGWNNNNCPPSNPTFSLANVPQWDNTQSGCLVGVNEGADYMTWAQVQTLSTVNNGINEIGAHTRSHNSISTLSAQDQVGEISGALSDLKAAGFNNVHVMAYPYGDYGCLTVNEVATAGCAPVAGNGTGTTAPVIGGLVQSAGYIGSRSSDIGLEGDQSGNPSANLPIYLASYAGDVTAGDAMTTAQLTAIVQSATSKGAWVVFLFHRVDECNAGTFPFLSTNCPSGQSPNGISIDDTALTGLAQYLKSNGVRTVTISQGLAMQGLNGQTQVPLAFPTE